MININLKNEELVKKIFDQSVVWLLLTVFNKDEFHKIALKKDSLKKTYTVIYVLNEQIYIEKKEILLGELGNQIISIDDLGRLHIEDISVKLTKPTKIVEKEENIYLKIVNKTTKKVQGACDEKIQALGVEFEGLQATMKEFRKYYTKDRVKRLKDLQKNLLFGIVSYDKWQTVNKENSLREFSKIKLTNY